MRLSRKKTSNLVGSGPAEVLLGRDTRPSGDALLKAAKEKMKGFASVIAAVPIDMGILTTPQLHWMVRARNKGMKASEHDYFGKLSSSFRCLMDLVPCEHGTFGGKDKLVVDGANGVGEVKLKVLENLLNGLVIEVRNTGEDGGILYRVGADYVQKEKVVPHGFGSKETRCASLDGDADRLIYFCVSPESSSKINLIDGDEILSLFALFIGEQLRILNEQVDTKKVTKPVLVLYRQLMLMEHQLITLNSSEEEKAALRLVAVSKLINQAVGDALSGLLLVEVILQHMGWSLDRWTELYQDLPRRQRKVKVADRTAVVTANAETVIVSPPGLQEAINAEIANYPRGRSFVRPSGTEDVVRVYAEASTQEGADSLAYSVAQLVEHFLG